MLIVGRFIMGVDGGETHQGGWGSNLFSGAAVILHMRTRAQRRACDSKALKGEGDGFRLPGFCHFPG